MVDRHARIRIFRDLSVIARQEFNQVNGLRKELMFNLIQNDKNHGCARYRTIPCLRELRDGKFFRNLRWHRVLTSLTNHFVEDFLFIRFSSPQLYILIEFRLLETRKKDKSPRDLRSLTSFPIFHGLKAVASTSYRRIYLYETHYFNRRPSNG